MPIEKRKYQRFTPQGNAFAALGQRYTRVGRIKDLSLGGLAFEYISAVDEDRNFSRIGIFLIGDVFHLQEIPCEVIYDNLQPVSKRNLDSIKLSPNKRCGVQFGTLTEDYLAQINFFLESYTKSSVL